MCKGIQFSLLLCLLFTVSCSTTSRPNVSHAVAPKRYIASSDKTTLNEWHNDISDAAGNILGPRGFWGSGITFNKTLSFTGKEYFNDNDLEIESPIYYQNKYCEIYSIRDYDSPKDVSTIEEGDTYGLHSLTIRDSTGRLRLFLANIYANPTHIVILCQSSPLSNKSSISELTKLLDNIITVL